MGNSFEIKGEVVELFDEQQVSAKFKKREFVIKVKYKEYEQFIKLQTAQDRTDILDKIRVGQDVKVSFYLQGKPFEKNGKTIYFTNLNCWKIEKIGVENTQKETPQSFNEPVKVPFNEPNDEKFEPLPF